MSSKLVLKCIGSLKKVSNSSNWKDYIAKHFLESQLVLQKLLVEFNILI